MTMKHTLIILAVLSIVGCNSTGNVFKTRYDPSDSIKIWHQHNDPLYEAMKQCNEKREAINNEQWIIVSRKIDLIGVPNSLKEFNALTNQYERNKELFEKYAKDFDSCARLLTQYPCVSCDY